MPGHKTRKALHSGRSLKSRIRSYGRHRSESRCVGKSASACRRAAGCKVAKGKDRTYCRSKKNVHTRRHGLRSLKQRLESYRRHRRYSRCAGKKITQCRSSKRCVVASGAKGKYCRKATNKHTRRYRKK